MTCFLIIKVNTYSLSKIWKKKTVKSPIVPSSRDNFFFNLFNWRLVTLQYCSGLCHTLTWISHGCTCVPYPEPLSHLPPHPIPPGHPSAPALSILSHASNLGWRSVSHMIIYIFQCYSLKSSHPRLIPQSPKDCSIYLCLFCCRDNFFFLIIYLFFAALGLPCCRWAFSSGEQELLSSCSAQASSYSGFSCCKAWALGAWALVVAANRSRAQVNSYGTWA